MITEATQTQLEIIFSEAAIAGGNVSQEEFDQVLEAMWIDSQAAAYIY